MPFSSNSMGFGAGPAGYGPFGHGPWITCPFTAQVVAADGYNMETPIVLFDDLTEQRFLLSRERGQSLTMDFTYADSSRITQVRSFFRAAGGQFTRMIVGNYRTGVPYVVRLISGSLPVAFRAGAIWGLEPFNFRVELNYPYADTVRADSAAIYWRMDFTSAQNTCSNNTLISSESGKLWDLLPHSAPHSFTTGVLGALNQDFSLAIGSTSASSNYLYLPKSMYNMSSSNNFTVEAWIKTAATTKSAVVSTLNGSAHLFFGVGSGGTAYFEVTAVNSTTTAGGTINDGSFHHVVGVRNKSASCMALWVDGSLVSSRADVSSTVIIGNPLWLLAYGANSYLTGFNFVGEVDDVAYYTYAMSQEIISRHYRIGAGID